MWKNKSLPNLKTANVLSLWIRRKNAAKSLGELQEAETSGWLLTIWDMHALPIHTFSSNQQFSSTRYFFSTSVSPQTQTVPQPACFSSKSNFPQKDAFLQPAFFLHNFYSTCTNTLPQPLCFPQWAITFSSATQSVTPPFFPIELNSHRADWLLTVDGWVTALRWHLAERAHHWTPSS